MSSAERNKAVATGFIERAFNQGDLSAVDEHVSPAGIDHQEPSGTRFADHLKDVITKMRAAFPDLRFEIHQVIAEGDLVAFRSTMTGAHIGRFEIGPFRDIAPTGRPVRVAHMHFVRFEDGRSRDLWHLWDTPALMRQLAAAPSPAPRG
jgi:predicted ester cyclase